MSGNRPLRGAFLKRREKVNRFSNPRYGDAWEARGVDGAKLAGTAAADYAGIGVEIRPHVRKLSSIVADYVACGVRETVVPRRRGSR